MGRGVVRRGGGNVLTTVKQQVVKQTQQPGKGCRGTIALLSHDQGPSKSSMDRLVRRAEHHAGKTGVGVDHLISRGAFDIIGHHLSTDARDHP